MRVLWRKSEVLEIDVASNHINDTHEIHEVSVTLELQEGETLLGCADLDAVEVERGWGPYRKYAEQDRGLL